MIHKVKEDLALSLYNLYMYPAPITYQDITKIQLLDLTEEK